jgi:hypothetical protein
MSTDWWQDPSDPAGLNDAGFPLFDGSLQNSNNFPLVTDNNDPISYSHLQQLRQSYYNGTKDFYLQNYPYQQQTSQIHEATPVQQQQHPPPPLPPQPPVIDHNYSQYDTLYDNIMVWNGSHSLYQSQPMNISLSAPTRLRNSNPTPPHAPPPAQAITTNDNRGLGLFIDNGNDKQTQYMHNNHNHSTNSNQSRNPDPQKIVHPPPRPPTYPPHELTFVHEANNFANKSSTNKIAKKKKSTTNLRRNNNQQKNVLMSVNDQLSTNQPLPPPPPQLQTPLKTKSSEPKSSPTTIPMKTSTGCIQKVSSSIPDNDLSISPTPMAKSSSMFTESTQFHDNSSPPKGVFINKHNRTPDLFSDFKDLEKSGEEITSKYFQNPQTLFAKHQQQQQQHHQDVSKSIAAFGSKPWNLDDEATKLIQQSDFLHHNNSNDIENLQ